MSLGGLREEQGHGNRPSRGVSKQGREKKTIQRCEDEDHEDHSPKGKKEDQKSPLIYIILN